MTSWARSRRPSLARIRLTWVLAVAGLTTSRPAISALDRPCATSRSTSRSRPVSASTSWVSRSEEHTSELQSHSDLVCRLLLEKKKNNKKKKQNQNKETQNT